MKYGKTELIRRVSDIVRNGWNNNAVRDLVESLWRDPYSMRTSGFVREGGTDADMSLEVTSTLVGDQSLYGITFAIWPVARKFDFYQFREILTYHKKYTAESLSFEALEGLHAVYYDFDPVTFEQVLVHRHNPDREQVAELMQWLVTITFFYYDQDSRRIIYWGDNRHGSWWNPWMHHALHRTLNSLRERGLSLYGIIADGDGTLDAHAQFGIAAGSAFHGDMRRESPGVAAPADLPVFYFVAGDLPRIHEAEVNSLVVQGLLCYNAGGMVTAAADGWFVLVHVFFTNCIYHPFIAVMGQAQYEAVSTASYLVPSEVADVRERLPHQNLLHVGTLILQTSVVFTNRYHSRIVSFAYGVKTDMSVMGDGSPVKPVKLVGDRHAPGLLMYYGTDHLGAKGYHPLQPDTTIIQPGHGFVAGTAIRHDGVRYVRAMADNDVHAQVCGIVSEVLDPDRFRYVVDGFIPSTAGEVEWEMGAEYFLSPVEAGKPIVLSDPEVWMIGQVRLSLGWGTTRGLKVEIDVGDQIGNYAGSEAFSFDKDFEWCVFAGEQETFKLDFSAGYAYTIARVKLESDGTLTGIGVKINGVAVTGLEDMTAADVATYAATGSNEVAEDDVVTISTTAAYSGTPTLMRVKLIFTIQ
jgi:hypothetical protein